MTLEQLESRDQGVFDRMCLKLDNGRWWLRRDWNDEIEGGSPSKLLISYLKTKYPSLPLRHFVWTMKEIGRNDIVQLLLPYVGQKTPTVIRELHSFEASD